MLVFEGPDGAGKTTLMNQFQEAFDLPIAPRVVSKDAEAMVDLREWVDQQLDQGFSMTMFDRHRLISEPIYGPILRDEPEAGFNEMKWLAPRMKRFYELKPLIIYCLPPLEVVMKNIESDDDNKVVRQKIKSIYSAYVAKASMDYSFAPTTIKVWDYTGSINIKDKPVWFNQVYKEMREATING